MYFIKRICLLMTKRNYLNNNSSNCVTEMETPGQDITLDFPKNPLLCPICHDYFTEPCILNCYHTFCARCLRGREQDRRLVCPFCR